MNIIDLLELHNSNILRTNMNCFLHVYLLYEIYFFSANLFAAHFKVFKIIKHIFPKKLFPAKSINVLTANDESLKYKKNSAEELQLFPYFDLLKRI